MAYSRCQYITVPTKPQSNPKKVTLGLFALSEDNLLAVPVPESLDDLVSVRDAANMCGVATSTIHSWAARNLIEPSDIDASGHKLYRRIDILKAEQKTRRRMLGANRIA